MPWDPMRDYRGMKANTDDFFSIWRSYKPVICKVHGYAVAGGSDIALCADIVIMAEDAKIGYMPARVWGCPTTAMWVYRLGAEKAKRMLLTGDTVDGRTAEKMGLVYQAVPAKELDTAVDALARRMAGRAEEPADDAEAHDQPGLREHGPRQHADDGDALRRHHAPLARGRLVQAATPRNTASMPP